jgi:hypothetical protein
MKYTDPHYSCDYLNFFIEKRENPYNQKTKDYVVAFHARNGFFEEPALSREDLKGLADFIYGFIDEEKGWVHSRPIVGIDENGQPIIIDSWGESNE